MNVKVEGILMRETDLAILLVQGTGSSRKEILIPKDQVKNLHKDPMTANGPFVEGWHATIELPEWLCEAKEIEIC